MANWVPVIAQAKSGVQFLCGDKEGAVQTQKDFIRRCPGISQVGHFLLRLIFNSFILREPLLCSWQWAIRKLPRKHRSVLRPLRVINRMSAKPSCNKIIFVTCIFNVFQQHSRKQQIFIFRKNVCTRYHTSPTHCR